jgi:anti-sigma regulatory factor (Ser/Thr protein kinase)
MRIKYSGNNMLISFNYFLSQADLADSSVLEFETVGNWLNVHPAALVFGAALSTIAGKENTFIKNSAGKSGIYLDRMGLYDFAATPSPYKYDHHEEAGRFVPIRQILTPEEQSKFVSDIIPLLHLDPDKSLAIKYVISELVRNTLEHSYSDKGAFVAAQYRRKNNSLSLGVCDIGIGLKASLDKYHHPKDDLDAIRLALMPGISGTTNRDGGSEDNGGAGLFIVKSMAKMTRNYFVIYSGDSMYKLLKYDKRVKHLPRIYADPFDDKHNVYEHLPNFHGTLVGIDMALDDTRKFNELYEVIKKSYSKAIRERKIKRYKEIKFV